MKIRLGFSTTDGIISRIIRWITEAQVSHAYIRLYDKHLHAPLVIHADWPGVIFEHADIFDENNIVIEEFEIEDERLHKGFKKNLKHLRKKYDWRSIVSWILILKSRRFKKWIDKKIQNPIEDPKKMICVDLVARILNDSEITHLPVGDLHPKRLRVWANDHYKKFGWKKINIKENNVNESLLESNKKPSGLPIQILKEGEVRLKNKC